MVLPEGLGLQGRPGPSFLRSLKWLCQTGGIPAGEGPSAQALTALQPGCPQRGMPAPSLPPLLLRQPLAPCAPRSLDGRSGAACSPSIHLGKKLIQKQSGVRGPPPASHMS